MKVDFADYKTVAEAANEWDVTTRMVQRYCAAGRIPGVITVIDRFLLPRDATKPEDLRKYNHRRPKKVNETE